MAVSKYAGDKYVGLSSDSKPNNVVDGAVFYETDTKYVYEKISGTWELITDGPTWVANTVTTNDATVTTIATIAVPDDTVMLIMAHIVGRRTDAADRAGYARRAVVYREAAGGATLQGTVDTVFTRESEALWDADISVSGNNCIITVKGRAGRTINWKSHHYFNLLQVS